MIRLVLGLVLGGLVGSAAAFDKYTRLQGELSAMRMEAREARTVSAELLSNGRWVRAYDAKTGHSVYRFAVRK